MCHTGKQIRIKVLYTHTHTEKYTFIFQLWPDIMSERVVIQNPSTGAANNNLFDVAHRVPSVRECVRMSFSAELHKYLCSPFLLLSPSNLVYFLFKESSWGLNRRVLPAPQHVTVGALMVHTCVRVYAGALAHI